MDKNKGAVAPMMLVSEPQQRALNDFIKALEAQVAAIHAAAEHAISANGDGTSPPSGVTVTIRAGAEKPMGMTFDEGPGSYCYSYNAICGKGPTGYIYCQVKYCMEIGPL